MGIGITRIIRIKRVMREHEGSWGTTGNHIV